MSCRVLLGVAERSATLILVAWDEPQVSLSCSVPCACRWHPGTAAHAPPTPQPCEIRGGEPHQRERGYEPPCHLYHQRSTGAGPKSGFWLPRRTPRSQGDAAVVERTDTVRRPWTIAHGSNQPLAREEEASIIPPKSRMRSRTHATGSTMERAAVGTHVRHVCRRGVSTSSPSSHRALPP